MKQLDRVILEKILTFHSQEIYYSSKNFDMYSFDNVNLAVNKGKILIKDAIEMVDVTGVYFHEMVKKKQFNKNTLMHLIVLFNKDVSKNIFGRKTVPTDDIKVFMEDVKGVPEPNRGYCVVLTDIFWLKFLTELFMNIFSTYKSMKVIELGREDLNTQLRQAWNLINLYLERKRH